MKYSKYIITTALVLSVSTVFATNSTNETANLIGASKVESIKFENGHTQLSPSNKKELKELVNSTGSKNIDEIKVLTWSDKTYPEEGQKVPDADIKLAQARGEAIKSYLKQLNVKDVDVHNMAERPNDIQQFFKTDDFEVKKDAEATGLATRSKSIFSSNGGPSTSLLMVVMEKKN